MKTYKRICIKDGQFTEGQKVLSLRRGEEYITSEETDGEVMVFSTYWAFVPVNLFAGEELFTRE